MFGFARSPVELRDRLLRLQSENDDLRSRLESAQLTSSLGEKVSGMALEGPAKASRGGTAALRGGASRLSRLAPHAPRALALAFLSPSGWLDRRDLPGLPRSSRTRSGALREGSRPAGPATPCPVRD